MDLPPIVPTTNPTTNPVPGTLPIPVTANQRRLLEQQQQRPSLSYLIFLSILFFFLNNRNDREFVRDTTTFDSIKNNLRTRELRRDGLATWLGVNTTFINTEDLINSTDSYTNTSIPIEFKPKSLINPVLQPKITKLLERKAGGGVFHHQNLTGLVRGNWRSLNMSLDSLGLEEAYNTTTLKEMPIEEEVSEVSEVAKKEEEEPVVDLPLIAPRAPVESLEEPKNITLEPKTHLVNITETTNRTENRGKFKWSSSGKTSFNLKEERSSVVGARNQLDSLEDGQLVRQKVGEMERWELEGPVSYLRGDITLSSADGKDNFVLDVEAVHFLSQGTIYGMVTPSYVVSHLLDVPGLPLLHSKELNRTALAAGHAILKEYDRRLLRDQAEFDTIGVPNQNPFVQELTGAPCVFTFYASISTLPASYSQAAYAEYFSSLYHPTGSSLKAPPPPTISYLLYSDNCGLVIEGEGEVLLSGVLWTRATLLAIFLGLVQAMMTVLLVRQMEWGGSASSCAKVAYFTIGMQAVIDSYFFITSFTVGVVTNNRSALPVLVPAFFALISSVFFGTRYTSNIKSATPSAPRPARSTRNTPPPPLPLVLTTEELAANAAEGRAAGEPPLVVTSASVIIPAYLQAPGAGSEDVKYLLIGLSIGLFCTFVVVLYGWVALFMSILYSYWIPQIVHNVQRGGARMSLRKEYIIGMTLGRLFLPIYVWGCPNNIAAIETSRWIYVLIFYSSFQALILILQDSHLGARFFIPTYILSILEITEEDIWNYHPLPLSIDLENNLSDQLKEDCPICFEPILEASTSTKEERERNLSEGVAEKDQRFFFMVPPCQHIAHTACLERWLAVKAICPVCRARLPQLQ